MSHNPFLRLGHDFTSQFHSIRPDIFHYQYTGPLRRVTREIVTVHDMSFARLPQYYSPAERFRLKVTVGRAVRNAAKVITISEFSKQEIVHFLGIPKEKVIVTYLGAGPEFRKIDDLEAIERTLARYSIRRPYVLAVGNISKRKNHRAAVTGFGRWINSRPDGGHSLVLAGKPMNAAAEVFAEASRHGVTNRLNVLGYVPEEDLPFLYAGAETLICTSVYEGFGLPLVEAMQSGVPVIASRASCFPEILGDAGRLVDPRDPDDILMALGEILENPEAKNLMIERGMSRARSFGWDMAARTTLQVYWDALAD